MKLFMSVLALSICWAFSARAQDKGQELYMKHCKRCHAEDGSGMKDGQPLAVAKTLKLEKPELLNLLSADAKKADAKKVIIEGKDKMKAMKDKVTAEEADLIVAYVKTLQAKVK